MKVFAAIWEHREGVCVSVFKSAESALRWRDEVADENWELEMNDEPKPTEAIGDAYFNEMGERGDRGEWFTIEETELED